MNILVNACLSSVLQQHTQDHVHHVLHFLVRIQLAMKSHAKEDTCAVREQMHPRAVRRRMQAPSVVWGTAVQCAMCELPSALSTLLAGHYTREAAAGAFGPLGSDWILLALECKQLLSGKSYASLPNFSEIQEVKFRVEDFETVGPEKRFYTVLHSWFECSNFV